MRTFSIAVAALGMLAIVGVGRSVATADDVVATPAPHVVASPAASDDVLPTIGRTHAVTTFCRRIVDDGSALASGQIDDIATTTEALRILALTPFDRSPFVQRRASLALETLSARLMSSRKGAAKTYVADLRRAAKDVPPGGMPMDVKHFNALPIDPAHADLARFAAALDGAHAESSRVAHEISRAVSTLGAIDPSDRSAFPPDRGMYFPDQTLVADPRFARALSPAPFPVDAELERGLNNRIVENGPLHLFARAMAFDIADSLERMVGSVNEARQLFPTAYVGCTDVDGRPSPPPDAPASEPPSFVPKR